VVEIGIPFSDPLADGSVIQDSHQRALKNEGEVGIKNALEFVQKMKKTYKTPIVFMLAVNLVYHFGIDHFFAAAGKAGLDGVIIPDLSLEESDRYLKYSKESQVSLIFLVAQTSSEERIRKIVAKSSGFIYLVSSKGTTGERSELPREITNKVKQIQKQKKIPVYVGFGISNADQVKQILNTADGVIVGSALVRRLAEKIKFPQKAINDICKEIESFRRIARS